MVELHNSEQLANHDGAFLEALETVAADLACRACIARLSIVRRGAAPRGRLYQHDGCSSADLQLAAAAIGVQQRWEVAARLGERVLEDPTVVVAAVPTRVLLQCALDPVASDIAWVGGR